MAITHSSLPPALRMTKARNKLIMDYPWFGSLAMRLNVSEAEGGQYNGHPVPTMSTNGQVIVYNPKFVETLTESEVVGVMAHEVLHCALLHPFRRGAREAKKWNVACDYAINQICADSGLSLPKNAIQPNPAYAGMSADQIYSILPEPTPEDEEKGGIGGGRRLARGQGRRRRRG